MAPRKRRRFPGLLLVLVVVGALVLGAGGVGAYVLWGGALRAADKSPYPPAKIADNLFTAPESASVDGLHQVFGDVAAVGNTVVAVGSECGGTVDRARFLVSTSGGRDWRVAPVKAAGGRQVDGSTPSVVVGAPDGWLAFGGAAERRAVWTSKDGLSWTQVRARSGAFEESDEVSEIVRTARGYVALGQDTAGTDQEDDDLPLVWLSADGRSWKRVGPERLELAADGGTVGGLRLAAARGTTVVIVGEIIDDKGDSKDAVWRSINAGRTWEPVDVPRPDKADPRIHGLSANRNGFFALRQSGKKDRHGVVLLSTDGMAWEGLGEIEPAGAEIAEFQRLVAGTQEFAAVAVTEDDHSVVYRSDDGHRWNGPTDLGWNEDRDISGVTPTPAGTVIVGTRVDSDQDFYLAHTRTAGKPTEVNFAEVADAVHWERALRAVVNANDQTIVVGSARGDAATWAWIEGVGWRTTGGESLAGDGQQRLSGATYGESGWLAVGEDESRPLVATSPDALSWSRVDDDAFEADDVELRTAAAAYGPEGYVVVGSSYPDDTPAQAAVWRSTDLEAWERVRAEDLVDEEKVAWAWMIDVAADDSTGYVAVGAVGDPDASGDEQRRPAVWMSQNGLSWDVRRPPLPTGATHGYLTRIAVRGRTVVALGIGQTADGAFAFAVTSRDDGKTWQAVRLPNQPSATDPDSAAMAVTPTDQGFAAASMAGEPATSDVVLWTSPDGKSWRAVMPEGAGLSGRGSQRIHGLAMIGDQLFGVGTSADITGEHVTLWRTSLPSS